MAATASRKTAEAERAAWDGATHSASVRAISGRLKAGPALSRSALSHRDSLAFHSRRAHRANPECALGACIDGDICMRGVLPIPSWLIPHWLLRWVSPLFFAKIVHLLSRLGSLNAQTCHTEDQLARRAMFLRRVVEDADDFYASARDAALVPEELWPREVTQERETALAQAERGQRTIDVGLARESPRFAVPAAAAAAAASPSAGREQRARDTRRSHGRTPQRMRVEVEVSWMDRCCGVHQACHPAPGQVKPSLS